MTADVHLVDSGNVVLMPGHDSVMQTLLAWHGKKHISLIDWISDALAQGYTNLQSLVKCLDHVVSYAVK